MLESLILDRYRPLSTAGSGGSGTVQICWDTRIQRRVAIKRVPVPLDDDGSIPGLAEARTGAMLKHPNIVSVIDFETSGQEAFLIMEAIEGPSLAELIDTTHKGGLDLDIIASVVASVGEALDYAHENGVLHLDIKPDNILIDTDGTVKVTDFGISELAGAQGFNQAVGGTIGYMPPEQILGHDLDQRTDEFALGVVVYEMLTGKRPFDAKSVNASLRLIRESSPAPVSAERRDTPAELDDIVLSAIDPNPDERFETVLELVDELVPCLGSPEEGKAKLRALSQSEDEEEEPRFERHGFWANMAPVGRAVITRASCAALCWWLAVLGLTTMGILKPEFSFGFALIAAALGALLPGIGAWGSIAVFGAGIIVNASLPTPLGACIAAAGCAWLALVGKERNAAANATIAVVPLGLIWATPLAPMAAGFALRPKAAAASATMQVVLAVGLASVFNTASLQHFGFFIEAPAQTDAASIVMGLVSNPASWIIAISWIIAAVCLSDLRSRESRVLSNLGIISACAVLIAAQVAIHYLPFAALSGDTSFSWCVAIACSTILMLVVGATCAPCRYKKDD